jgi:hypothetical protein
MDYATFMKKKARLAATSKAGYDYKHSHKGFGAGATPSRSGVLGPLRKSFLTADYANLRGFLAGTHETRPARGRAGSIAPDKN